MKIGLISKICGTVTDFLNRAYFLLPSHVFIKSGRNWADKLYKWNKLYKLRAQYKSWTSESRKESGQHDYNTKG